VPSSALHAFVHHLSPPHSPPEKEERPPFLLFPARPFNLAMASAGTLSPSSAGRSFAIKAVTAREC